MHMYCVRGKKPTQRVIRLRQHFFPTAKLRKSRTQLLKATVIECFRRQPTAWNSNMTIQTRNASPKAWYNRGPCECGIRAIRGHYSVGSLRRLGPLQNPLNILYNVGILRSNFGLSATTAKLSATDRNRDRHLEIAIWPQKGKYLIYLLNYYGELKYQWQMWMFSTTAARKHSMNHKVLSYLNRRL